MAGFPEPQVGLVVSYAYLWFEESERGQVEGAKDRPCAIVLAIEGPGDPGAPLYSDVSRRKQVAVAPITHSSPRDLDAAVEIPPRVKVHLGLDSDRSWVVLDEVNVFVWPGYDLRPIRRGEERIDYGLLPPRFFDRLIAKFSELEARGKCRRRRATGK
jgi:hypothetical protein